MQMLFELGPEFIKLIGEISAVGDAVRAGGSEGLHAAVRMAADHVSENYLTGQYLGVRTGNLRNAVTGFMASDFDGVVGIPEGTPVKDYMYQLGDETVTITPKKGKYLTIPIGEALTPSGVLKGQYAGGLKSIEGGFFFESNGQLLFGIRRGKTQRAKVRPLFVLKREVTIHGTGALFDGVDEKLDDMTEIIGESINKKLEN